MNSLMGQLLGGPQQQNSQPNIISVNVVVIKPNGNVNLSMQIDPNIEFIYFVQGISEQLIPNKMKSQYEDVIECRLLGGAIIQQNEIRTLKQLGFKNQCCFSIKFNLKKTLQMIFIEANNIQFEIKSFDEEFITKNQLNKQQINPYLYIISQNNNIIITEIEFQQRFCQQHNKQIDKICAEKECKKNNLILLCQVCARFHKGHNQYDISEALYLIQQKEKRLNDDEKFIEIIKCKTFSQFKILKSKNNQQLQEIENNLTSAFNNYKQYLQVTKSNYQQAFNQLQSGGLSKMIEQVNYIFDQGLFEENNNDPNEQQYKQLAQQLNFVQQNFQQLVKEETQDFVTIKINNYDLKIANYKIENLNDLYYQIKIDALKQKFSNILGQELLLLKNNKAIRLKGNQQPINLKNEYDLEIISYQEI